MTINQSTGLYRWPKGVTALISCYVVYLKLLFISSSYLSKCGSFKGLGGGEARNRGRGRWGGYCWYSSTESAQWERGGGAKLLLAARAGPRGRSLRSGSAAAAAATLPACEAGRPRPGPSPEPLFIGASWSPRAGSAWGRAQARPAAEPRTEVACPRTRPAQPWWGSEACLSRSRQPPWTPRPCPPQLWCPVCSCLYLPTLLPPPRGPTPSSPWSLATYWGDSPPPLNLSPLGDTLFLNHPQWQLLSRSPLPIPPRPLTRPSFSPLPFCLVLSFGKSTPSFFFLPLFRSCSLLSLLTPFHHFISTALSSLYPFSFSSSTIHISSPPYRMSSLPRSHSCPHFLLRDSRV